MGKKRVRVPRSKALASLVRQQEALLLAFDSAAIFNKSAGKHMGCEVEKAAAGARTR